MFFYQVVSLPAYYGWYEVDMEALSHPMARGRWVATILRKLGSSYKGQLDGAVLGKQSNGCTLQSLSLSAHHGALFLIHA